jgi:DNA polymerase alpha subunit A
MPQVQVALRALDAGRTVRVNDVISYVTCAQNPESLATESASAKRAFAPMDVQKSAGSLKPDVEWYLAKQIFPPIERLCAPIDGTDAGQLAECLGLDPKRYAMSATARGEQGLEITPLESQLPDSVRYQDCPRLQLTCLACRQQFVFEGMAGSPGAVTPQGLRCPREECGKAMRPLTAVAQVEAAVRQLAARYYDAWLVCDEPTCGARTRSLSVYGHRCLGPAGLARGCSGRMRYEMGGKLVGATLGYWKGLFDVDKAARLAPKGEEGDKVRALREWNRERFGTVVRVLEGYERRCGWVWVQMDTLFGFALK